jgi:hypothetical protein
VAGSEDAVEPGGFGAFDRIFLIVHSIIAEDVSPGGIGGRDVSAPMDDAAGLIEIDGFGDVVGNDRIVLPDLSYAIHLHRQKNRNALSAKIAGESYCGRSSPALAEENDVGASFFFS